jgi:hypothetical protein
MNFNVSSLSPIKVFLYSWLMWVFAYFLRNFEYSYNNFSYESSFIFLLLNLLFFFGMLLASKGKNDIIDKKYVLKEYQLIQIFNVLIFFAIISCILRLYSIFFIQNYLAFETSYEFKMSIMYEVSSAGAIGILSSITLPATLLILFINLIYEIVSFKSIKGFIVIAASLLLVIDSALKSSFLYIVIYIMFIFFTIILKNVYIRKKIFKVRLYYILPLFILGLVYFGYIYQFRVSDLDYVLNNRLITPNSNEVSYISFMIINFIHYILHGYYQWVDLYNSVGLSNYYFGMIEFYPIVKFLKSFIFPNLPGMGELISVLPRGAVYYTFWGDFILDFGFFSLIFSFLFGYLSFKIYLNFKKRYFVSTIFYPFILILIFFMPYKNLTAGVFGYFVIFILVLKLVVTLHYIRNTE